MSTATATANAAAPAASGGKKKLIIIIAAVLVLVLGGGGAAWMLLKPKPHAEDDADGHAAPGDRKARGHADRAAVVAPRSRTADPKRPPIFVPLDPFTVNLADRDADRYAQIGITLELDDAKIGEELKLFMPAIRNNILMALAGRTAAQMLSREGKDKLARSILYATVRPLGFPAFEDDEEDAEDEGTSASSKKKKRRQREQAQMVYPVTAVHFSTFIVQ